MQVVILSALSTFRLLTRSNFCRGITLGAAEDHH
jgi:hypothetical protein